MKKAVYAFALFLMFFLLVAPVNAQDQGTDNATDQSLQPADSSNQQQDTENSDMNQEETKTDQGVQDQQETPMNQETQMNQGTQMNQEGSQTGMTMSSKSQGEILDLSSLDEEVTEQQRSEFMSIAQEHANNLRDKVGLDAGKTEKVREAIAEYLEEEWSSRVSLDQDKHDSDEAEE